MTVQEAIDHVDKMRPNQFDTTTKVRWLSKLDGMIFNEVIMTHEHPCHIFFDDYDDSCMDRKLLVPPPYDEDVYNYFLQTMIDKENAEYKRYNQSVTLYNNAYQTFQSWYNRTHMPLPRHTRYRY